MTTKELLDLLIFFPDKLRHLDREFEEYRNNRQLRVFASRLLWLFSALGAILIGFLLIERTPLQSEFIRFLASVIGYALLVFGVIKASRAFTIPPNNVEIAVEIEKFTGKFNSALSSSAEFLVDGKLDADPSTSSALKKLTIAQSALALKDDDIQLALSKFSRRKAAKCFLVVLAIVFVWTAAAPYEMSRAMHRLANPFRSLAPYSSLEITVFPLAAVVPRGGDIQISAIPNQPIEREPVLTLFAPGSEEGFSTEMYPEDVTTREKFVYSLSGLQETTDFEVSYDKLRSERYSITVVPRPEITTIGLTLHQPEYISPKPQKLEPGVGDAVVLRDSKVEIKGEADQKIKSAVLSLGEIGTHTLDISEERFFSTTLTIATDTKYSVFLTNEYDLSNENPVQYTISAVDDASPTVTILRPAADIPFPKSKRLDLKVVARDDFGVTSVILFYRVGNRRTDIPLNMRADMTPTREYEVEYPWLLDTLALAPGTEVTYYVQVEDCKAPVANVASTTTFKISMPSMFDISQGADRAHRELTERLRDMMKDQQMRREALGEAFEQIKHEGKLDYETERQLDAALENALQREKDAAQMLEAFEKLQERYLENPFSNHEVLERMQQVEELLDQVLDEDTKRLREELTKALEDMQVDPSKIENFEDVFKMDEHMKNLDRTIELLQQLRDIQQLDSLGKALEDLHRRQEEIASQTAELQKKAEEEGLSEEEQAQLEDLAKAQEKIRQELEEIQKEAEELASKTPKPGEFENPLLEDVKNIRDMLNSEDFQEMSQNIEESLKDGDLENAGEKQKDMLRFLDGLKKQGQKISEACSAGGGQQLDLSRFIRSAIYVSKDQEKLLNMIIDFPGQFMRGHQPAIEGVIDESSILQLLVKNRAEMLRASLDSFIRTSFVIDPEILDHISDVDRLFSEIVKNLEDRSLNKAREDQREIIRRFNILAMELMRKQDEAQSGSSGAAPMNALQQFRELARRQLSLYQEMMKRQMQPGDGDSMEQLRQMAMRQRMIREALEQLMKDAGDGMKTLGRLDDIMEDMLDLETQILDPELQRDVADKQKAVYERMLRAMKSLRDRDEESEERKAQSPVEIIQEQPDEPLPDAGVDDTRDLSRDFLGETREDYPSEYEALLQDYFKSLSLYGENQ
jgi:hypothetical protein